MTFHRRAELLPCIRSSGAVRAVQTLVSTVHLVGKGPVNVNSKPLAEPADTATVCGIDPHYVASRRDTDFVGVDR